MKVKSLTCSSQHHYPDSRSVVVNPGGHKHKMRATAAQHCSSFGGSTRKAKTILKLVWPGDKERACLLNLNILGQPAAAALLLYPLLNV